MKELIEELGSLAEKLSAGWHEGIEIDASDIMLMNKTADLLEQQAAEIETEIELRRKAEQGLVDWRVKYTELQAKLSAMEKQEPVLEVERMPDHWSNGYFYDDGGSYISEGAISKLPIGTKLFTAPKVAQPPEALEALFTNIDHAISSGAWKVQEGSQTWETIQEAKAAIGGQQP